MNFYLKNYNNYPLLLVVARCESVRDELLSRNFNVAYLEGNNMALLPQNRIVEISLKESEKISLLNDYDIIEINEMGVGYRPYSSSDADTAIVITPSCNSNCIMCPASESERKNKGIYPLESLNRFIEYLPNHLYNIVVTGGEPTLGKDVFLEVFKSLKEKFTQTKILLLTNGRSLSMNNFFAQILSVLPRNLRIAIPLHGADAQIHDYITQTPGSFNETVKGVQNVINAKIELELRIVISKLNADYLSEIAEYIVNHFSEVCIVNFVGLEVRGNCAKNASAVFIEYEEGIRKAYKAIDLLVSAGIDVRIYNYSLCVIDKAYWPIAAKSIATYKSKFYDECNACTLKQSCCGIFQASMAFIKPKVYPVILGEEIC
jgi:His-Xaa-Ser system radical SAM maturase HxsC